MRDINECYDLLIQYALQIAFCEKSDIDKNVSELRNLKRFIEYAYETRLTSPTHVQCSYIDSLKDKYSFKKTWCDELLAKIEAIADEKYPNKEYWVDTGSRVDVALAMLETMRKDLK